MLKLTRRRVLEASAAVALASAARGVASSADAADAIESHGMSAFGDLTYPADFRQFRYVNPNAPKGGTFSQIGPDRLYNQNFLTFIRLKTFLFSSK